MNDSELITLLLPKACQTDNVNFIYHKPVNTFCNNDANVCAVDGCTGNVCNKFNTTNSVTYGDPSNGYTVQQPAACTLTGDQECEVSCVFFYNGSSYAPCLSTFDFANTVYGHAQNVVRLWRLGRGKILGV